RSRRMTKGIPRLFSGPALEDQRGVRSTESEGIGQRVVHGSFARNVRDIVQIAFRVGVKLIDRRRQNLIAQGENTDASFESSGAAQKMPGHGFCRAYWKFLIDRAVAKQALHRGRFDDVADRRRRSVRVDIADV